jgi:hypothetical protein
VGHAATACRSARVSGPRRLARPTGLPRSSQTPVSEVFVLAELTPNAADLSVKHLGGVRRPAPSAGSSLGRGQETRAQRGFELGAGSGDPRRARARSRVAYNKQLRNIKTCASGYYAPRASRPQNWRPRNPHTDFSETAPT